LRLDWRAAQGDAICFENVVAAKKREPARGFLHADTIGHGVRGEGMQVEVRANHRGDGEEAKQGEHEREKLYHSKFRGTRPRSNCTVIEQAGGRGVRDLSRSRCWDW